MLTLSDITLNEKQQQAHDMMIEFVRQRGRLLTIGGYAGTGKTTLIGKVVETLKQESHVSIAFVCFTGKASIVLKSKISEFMGPMDYCGTIHGLIYKLVGKINGRMIWERRDSLDHGLIILDEASMVDEVIFRDLQSYGVPIVAIGDHGQLPPVSGSFNLMENPDFKLEQIIRQAEGNPIIKLSMMVRETGNIPFGEFKVRGTTSLKDLTPDIVLCATNQTRCNINAYMRARAGITSPDPMPEEPVICLRNNRDQGIFNGMIGTLKDIQKKASAAFYSVSIDFDEFVYNGTALKAQFSNKELLEVDPHMVDSFDFAYCITTHKAQGSEFKSVVLIEERMRMMNDDQWRRWLYTGITRAKEKLLIMTKW